MSVRYTYSISGSFPAGKVALDRFTQEIRESSIDVALDYINTISDSCYIWFKAPLLTTEVLDSVVSNHNGLPLLQNAPLLVSGTVSVSTLQSSTSALIVQEEPPEGVKLTFISPNWCDKTTWYYSSVRVDDELLFRVTSSSFSSPYVRPWVDVTHGKLSNERMLRDQYAPIIKVNNVVVSESTPDLTDKDFQINYNTGEITFNFELQESDIVTASYNYVSGSSWSIFPSLGKKIRIIKVEVQFSENVEIRDTSKFQLLVNGVPYGNGVWYQTMYDYVNESNLAYPRIPALGGSSWRGIKSPIYVFHWDYLATIDLKSSLNMSVSVDLENNVEFGGDFAVATFYCLSVDE